MKLKYLCINFSICMSSQLALSRWWLFIQRRTNSCCNIRSLLPTYFQLEHKGSLHHRQPKSNPIQNTHCHTLVIFSNLKFTCFNCFIHHIVHNNHTSPLTGTDHCMCLVYHWLNKTVDLFLSAVCLGCGSFRSSFLYGFSRSGSHPV